MQNEPSWVWQVGDKTVLASTHRNRSRQVSPTGRYRPPKTVLSTPTSPQHLHRAVIWLLQTASRRQRAHHPAREWVSLSHTYPLNQTLLCFPEPSLHPVPAQHPSWNSGIHDRKQGKEERKGGRVGKSVGQGPGLTEAPILFCLSLLGLPSPNTVAWVV